MAGEGEHRGMNYRGGRRGGNAGDGGWYGGGAGDHGASEVGVQRFSGWIRQSRCGQLCGTIGVETQGNRKSERPIRKECATKSKTVALLCGRCGNIPSLIEKTVAR